MAADKAVTRILGRVPWGIVSFGIAVFFGWQYWELTQSEESPLAMKKAEIESAQNEVTALKVRLAEVEKFQKSLISRREKLASAKALLDARKAAVPEELDPVSFTGMLSRKAEDVGLRVVSLRPEGRVRKEYYEEHPFQLEFTGVYVQLYRFLQDVAAVPMIVQVQEMSLKPVGPNSAKYVALRGTLRLAAFSYVRSEADAVVAGGPAPSSSSAAGQGEGQ